MSELKVRRRLHRRIHHQLDLLHVLMQERQEWIRFYQKTTANRSEMIRRISPLQEECERIQNITENLKDLLRHPSSTPVMGEAVIAAENFIGSLEHLPNVVVRYLKHFFGRSAQGVSA